MRPFSAFRAMTLALAATLLAAGAVPGPASADPGTFDPLTIAELQAATDEARAQHPVPGISAAIHLGDGTRWEGVAGVGERGASAWPVQASTSFVVGSITKTFVAAAVLQLADEGALTLDDPLSRWLPDHPRGATVTLRHLLGHTSGEANYFTHRDYEWLVFGRPTHHWTSQEILTLVGKPRFAPGTDYQYSNTNYILLGLVLEAATGGSVAAVIRDRFLDPLRLQETWFQGEEVVPVEPAHAYLRQNGRWVSLDDGTYFRPHTSAATVAWAAGAMISSASDLAKWARALYGGRVLSDASLAEMVTFSEDDYGLGTKEYLMGGRTAWGHGGSLRGAEATMRYVPSLDAAVVVLWNRGRVETADLARELAAIAFSARYPDTTAPVITDTSIDLRVGAALDGRIIPARLTWSTTETESGVDRYEVRMSVDGAAWETLPTDGPAASGEQPPQSLDVELSRGRRYAFSVMATDAEGNVGAWADSPVIRPRILQETHSSLGLDDGWRFVARSSASGGGVAKARQPGIDARSSGKWLAIGWV
ncbi:MAG: beta-lactamase family protein, partial [Chloroflexota bacterium]|nr:beta-lactamase family protein [Chloroflexota bacterium]